LYKSLIKPLLFLFQPEKAHHITFTLLKVPGVSTLLKAIYGFEDKRLEREVFGLRFKNPVGLAAGFDKNALRIDEFADLGFGFVEIGTVTPKAQPGNEKPRLFRIKVAEALINRMGFNNEGVAAAVERLKKRKSKIIVGGNIGKNKITPNEEAEKDYLECFERLFDYVDYFVVNVSSPNTPNLRALQEKEPLKKLLSAIQQRNREKAKPKPVLLKIAPDLTNEQLDDIIEIVKETGISGVVATNTTIAKVRVKKNDEWVEFNETGGLSGKPLTQRSTEVIRYLAEKSGKAFPIIGVGGIHTQQDALEKLKAGASLVQLYTGYIYEGPALLKRIKKAVLADQ